VNAVEFVPSDEGTAELRIDNGVGPTRLPFIELLADANAQPPLGIEGIEATDKGKERHGKLCFGALGIGGLKLKLHRACIGKLFDSSERVLDAEEIYALAKEMA